MNHANQPLRADVTTQPLLHAACLIAAADFDIARRCNRQDRMTIGSHALVLLLAGTLALVAWSTTLAMFLPMWEALAMALIPAGMIFMLDRQMAASDWDYAGILRTGPRPPGFWFKVGARIGIAGCLSIATATGLSLALFNDEIANYQQRQRQHANLPLVQEYSRMKQAAAERLVAPLEVEIKALADERAELLRSITSANTQEVDAHRHASAMRIEAGREADGGMPGYVVGRGPRFLEAERQRQEADKQGQLASTRAAAARDRLDKLTARIDGKTVELRTANAELAAEHARLERSMLADDRHVPERRGFLGAYVALQALRADPEEGEAVTWFYHMTMSGLMIFELAFLLMKVVFAHASVYTVRLRARTQHEAAQVSIEYADNVADLRGQRHRPSWRLVNGADQPDESESRASKGRDSYQ